MWVQKLQLAQKAVETLILQKSVVVVDSSFSMVGQFLHPCLLYEQSFHCQISVCLTDDFKHPTLRKKVTQGPRYCFGNVGVFGGLKSSPELMCQNCACCGDFATP